MPPGTPPASPDIARVTLVYTAGNGVIINNVLHFYNAASFSDTTQLTDLLTEVAEVWNTSTFKATINPSMILDHATAHSLETTPPPSAFLNVGAAGLHGGGASPAMPNNVTAAVKLGTALGGRSYRGRVYHPGLSEDQCVGDFLGSGVAADLIAAWDGFRTHSYTDGSVWVVLSTVADGAYRPFGVSQPITSVTCDNTLDSQRRRLLGRGR